MRRFEAFFGLFALLVGASATGDVFEDDFESGAILTSATPVPGKWSELTAISPGCSLTASPAAAHRGQFGMRFVDGENISGAGAVGAVGHYFSPEGGDHYLRFWFREAVRNTLGAYTPVMMAGDGPNPNVANFVVLASTDRLVLAGANAQNIWIGTDIDFAVDGGQWHLIELAIEGLETSTGRRRMWIDGLIAADDPNFDFSSIETFRFVLGQGWSDDKRFTGTFDIDDFRAARKPHAASLRIEPFAQSWATTECVPLTITAIDHVNGTPAEVPYPVEVEMWQEPAVGTLYVDPQCTTSVARVTIPEGQSAQTAYFRTSQPGTIELVASHSDFLKQAAQPLVIGMPAGAACALDAECVVRCSAGHCVSPQFGIGCGCQADGQRGPFAFALLWLLRMRQARRRSQR